MVKLKTLAIIAAGLTLGVSMTIKFNGESQLNKNTSNVISYVNNFQKAEQNYMKFKNKTNDRIEQNSEIITQNNNKIDFYEKQINNLKVSNENIVKAIGESSNPEVSKLFINSLYMEGNQNLITEQVNIERQMINYYYNQSNGESQYNGDFNRLPGVIKEKIELIKKECEESRINY